MPMATSENRAADLEGLVMALLDTLVNGSAARLLAEAGLFDGTKVFQFFSHFLFLSSFGS